MLKGKTAFAILAVSLFIFNTGFAQSLEENFNDFLHYTKIGRFDLAKGYARAVIESNPDPVLLLELSKDSPKDYEFLLKVSTGCRQWYSSSCIIFLNCGNLLT